MITIKTNQGDIKLTLDNENTPNTTANFLQYANSGFYDNTIFHRVIKGFMIQGGGFEPGMKKKSTQESIQNEAEHANPNKRGTIAMARTSDPHSATAQFFINVIDNDFLNFSKNDLGYCVFGEVTEGMDIVDKIKAVTTTSKHGHQDVPEEDVIIEKVIVDS